MSSDLPLDALLERFVDTSIAQDPVDAEEYGRFLQQSVLPHVINVGHERCFGHMTSPLPAFHGELAKLIAALNQNVVKVETSKVLTLLERQVLGKLHRLVFDRPASFYDRHLRRSASAFGVTTSGGTLSNVTALWMARNAALDLQDGRSMVAALAAKGYQDVAIVGSQLVHYSLHKAASLLGVGQRNVISVEVDAGGRTDPAAFEAALAQCDRERKLVIAAVGVAGSTETGSVDDLVALGEVARRRGVHFHVDAAWGGPLLFSGRHRDLLRGIENADTASLCGHKQLYLPQGMSVLLCRDPSALSAIRVSARYQAREGSMDLGAMSAEGSRGPHCLHLHAALQMLGARGYAELIDTSLERAQDFAALVRDDPAFELMEDPHTNLVIYRFVPRRLRAAEPGAVDARLHEINRVNERLQQLQFTRGSSLVSRTTIGHGRHGRRPAVVLRAVFINPRATVHAMRSVLLEQQQIGDSLEVPK